MNPLKEAFEELRKELFEKSCIPTEETETLAFRIIETIRKESKPGAIAGEVKIQGKISGDLREVQALAADAGLTLRTSQERRPGAPLVVHWSL